MFTAINPATNEPEPFRLLTRQDMDTYDRLCASGRVFSVKTDANGNVQGYVVAVPDHAYRAAAEKERQQVEEVTSMRKEAAAAVDLSVPAPDSNGNATDAAHAEFEAKLREELREINE